MLENRDRQVSSCEKRFIRVLTTDDDEFLREAIPTMLVDDTESESVGQSNDESEGTDVATRLDRRRDRDGRTNRGDKNERHTDPVSTSNQQLECEVAERELGEEQVREREQRIRSLVEQTSDAVIVVDEEGNIVAVLRSLGEVPLDLLPMRP